MALAQALVRCGRSARLFCVTRDAQRVVETDRLTGLSQALLWGFGRTLAHEHPELWGALVDLDVRDAPAEAARTIADVLANGDEAELAVRAGVRHVPRLVRRQNARHPERISLRSDAAVLITGGLGDLGLAVARWAVSRGARELVLLGRSGLPPRAEWDAVERSALRSRIEAVRALETAGARIRASAVDIADETSLRDFFNAYEGPPIQGGFHLSGVADGSTILQLELDRLENVARPKALGACLLHRLLRDEPLDFFEVFSSPASLLGFYGQGGANYAAANAYLDAFAQWRRAAGLPAQALNWGPWSEIGLAARSGQMARLAAAGIRGLPTEPALHLLDSLLRDDAVQVAIMNMDWALVRGSYAEAPPSMLRELLPAIPKTSSASRGAAARAHLLAAPEDQRTGILRDFLRNAVADALGIASADLDMEAPLTSLGIDSLLTLDLRNRIEQELSASVSFAHLLDGMSTEGLAGLLLPRITAGAAVPQVAAERPPLETADPLRAQLEGLSEQALDAILNTALEQ